MIGAKKKTFHPSNRGKKEEEERNKQTQVAQQQMPFQSNPYGTTRSVTSNSAADLFGGGDNNDSNDIFGSNGVNNSNDPFQPQATGSSNDPFQPQQPLEQHDSDNSNNSSNAVPASNIFQQKQEIIQQQNKESETDINNAAVTVPTIEYNESGEGDSI